MAYRCEVVSKVINTGGNIPISLADFGGDTPKLVMVQSTKSTADGSYQDDAFYSLGWGDLNQEDSAQLGSLDNVSDSVVARGSKDSILMAFDIADSQALDGGISVTDDDPAVVNLTGHGYATGDLVAISGVLSADAIVKAIHSITKLNDDSFSIPVNNTVAGTEGQAVLVTDLITLVSFSADEFVINVSPYGGTPFTVLFMVLGGSDLTDVKVGSFLAPTAADSVTGSDISFLNGGGGASTITAIANRFGAFSTGQIIEVSGSVSNDGFYTIDSATLTVITLATGVLTDESAGASVTVLSGFFDVAVGFDDVDAVMMFTSQNDNGNRTSFIFQNNREAAFGFGFFEVDNGTQCAECRIYSDDAEATMETLSVAGSNTNCWTHYSFKSGAWAIRGQFTFVSVVPGGFRLKQSTGSSVPAVAYRINYVALKGGSYEVIQKAAPTSPGTQDIVNSEGFTPAGSMFLLGVAGGVNVAAMSMGWASNDGGAKPYSEGVAFVSDDDNVATSFAKRLTKTDKCLVHDFAGSTTVRNEADLHTWNSDGETLDFTTASIGFVYHAIMLGNGSVTPVTTTDGDPQNFRRQVIH